jgi:hypothetical protein
MADEHTATAAEKWGLPGDRIWDAIIVSLSLGIFVSIAAVPVLRLNAHIMLGHNEGWNAYYALAAVSGGDLYPSPDAFISNNYPPLSFYVVGLFGRLLGGDYVVAGRILSLLSLLMVARNVFAMSRWLGVDGPAAAFAAAIFLVMFGILTPEYIGQDEPQIFGHALVTSGAVIFLARPVRLPQMALAAGLMIAGGLVKQNLVALPLALCCWAAIHDPLRLRMFAIAGALIGGAAAALLYSLWGYSIVAAVLLPSRVVDWDRMLVFAGVALITKLLIVFTVLTAAACIALSRRVEAHFLALYVVVAAIVGFPMLSGAGVNFNVLNDYCIALSLGSAAVVSLAAQGRIKLPWLGAVPYRLAMLAIVATLSLQVIIFFQLRPDHYDKLWEEPGSQQALVEILANANGPVACETLVICFWAGKPQEIDFFNYGQKLFTGLTTDTELRRRISEHYYRYVVVDVVKTNSKLWPPRLPDDTDAWLRSHYVPVSQHGDNILLRPKTTTSALHR